MHEIWWSGRGRRCNQLLTEILAKLFFSDCMDYRRKKLKISNEICFHDSFTKDWLHPHQVTLPWLSGWCAVRLCCFSHLCYTALALCKILHYYFQQLSQIQTFHINNSIFYHRIDMYALIIYRDCWLFTPCSEKNYTVNVLGGFMMLSHMQTLRYLFVRYKQQVTLSTHFQGNWCHMRWIYFIVTIHFALDNLVTLTLTFPFQKRTWVRCCTQCEVSMTPFCLAVLDTLPVHRVPKNREPFVFFE